MDPTCRSCGDYPCTCGRAIGVPIATADGLMIRYGSGLVPYEEPKPKTSEEIAQERRELEERKKQAKIDARKEFDNGTHSQDVANDILYEAVQKNDFSLVKTALEKGACPTLRISIGRPSKDLSWNGDTILHVAISNKNAEIVQALVASGVDVNLIGNKNMYAASGFTPLLLAIRKNSPKIVEILLKAGAKKDIRDSVGRNANDMPCDNDSIKRLLSTY